MRRYIAIFILAVAFAITGASQTVLSFDNSADSAESMMPDLSVSGIIDTTTQTWIFGVPPDPREFGASIWIQNPGDKPVNVQAEAFDSRGDSMGIAEAFDIAPGKFRQIKTANLNGHITAGAAKVVISANQPIGAHEVVNYMKGNWSTTLHGVPGEVEGLAVAKSATSSCCGYSSSSNPYPCCNSLGNCTWWAWKQAKEEWGKKLPSWGNAGRWAANARSSGYPVKGTPKSNTIGVNTWIAGTGHVTWVRSVSGSTVSVSEMNWCSTCKQYKNYPASWFDGGFIYKK